VCTSPESLDGETAGSDVVLYNSRTRWREYLDPFHIVATTSRKVYATAERVSGSSVLRIFTTD